MDSERGGDEGTKWGLEHAGWSFFELVLSWRYLAAQLEFHAECDNMPRLMIGSDDSRPLCLYLLVTRKRLSLTTSLQLNIHT